MSHENQTTKVQRPRVQSRFRVSPSPRKVPMYKLIDEETAQQPFQMVRLSRNL